MKFTKYLAPLLLSLLSATWICINPAQAQVVNPSQPATGVPLAGTGIAVAGQTVSINYGLGSQTYTGNFNVSGTLTAGTFSPASISTGALSATGAVTGAGFSNLFAAAFPIGSTTPNTGAFTTLANSGTFTSTGAAVLNGAVSGTGIATYEANINHVQTVATVAALRAVSCVPGLLYADQGYTTIADGGASTYVCNGADTTTADNGGSILASASTFRLYLTAPSKSVNVFQFGAKGNGSTNDTAAIQAAITWAIGQTAMRVEVSETSSFYLISSTLDMGDASVIYAGLQFIGLGLPTIQSSNLTAPIMSLGGERMDVEGFRLQYASQPSGAQTNAVAIRIYNMYESIIRRMYFNQVYRAIDQFQGLVVGTQNAFYSNHISDWRVVNWTDSAINLVPFGGGNSGNVWDNIYLSNNLLSSGGAVNLAVSSDSVFNQLNIEHGTIGVGLVLNGCDSIVFNALHFEGYTPSAAFQPLIDVYNTVVVFNALNLELNAWGASTPTYLFRATTVDSSVIMVNGLKSRTNTTPASMNFATIAYGNYIYAQGVFDADSSLSSSVNVPRVAITGSPSAGVDYPIAQFNRAAGVLRQREGTNAKQVTGTLVAGTVTVANATVTATSRILCTRQPGGANPGAVYVPTITAATSFVVTSTNAGDTGNVACEISEAN